MTGYFESYAWLWQMAYGGYIAFIFSTILLIVLENRSPVRTMAWMLVLLFLPVIGLLLYFLFGRNTRKLRMISRKSTNRLNNQVAEAYHLKSPATVESEWERLATFFLQVNDAYPLGCRQITLLTDGYTYIRALLKAIYEAKHHIHLEAYILQDDAIGRLVRDALIDKAQQGVQVRVIYDDVGSWRTPARFFEQMRFAGIEVEGFLKVRFPMFTSQVNYRNHRKICIIDGKTGFIGGMNLAIRYLKGIHGGNWRDTHVRVEGSIVYSLQARFLADWYFTNRTLITASKAYYPDVAFSKGGIAQVVSSSPIGQWRDMMQGMLMLITNAKKYLYIQTPYLLPTQQILVALQTAALSGVDVRIMVPRTGDSFWIHKASMSYFTDLMKAGVQIYLYRKGFIHSKVWVVDDQVCSIGSANMDFRSFEFNFEANLFVYDTAIALETKKIFLEDQKDTTLLSPLAWEKRHWKHRIAESILRLFAPLL